MSLPDDPEWYRDAVVYELHVRSFADSDDDGVGDFRGLISKLDYLADLGVSALWLLPFYPSPLRDDGYDIADYTGVHPSYGTMRDFRAFLRAAHARGLRVITELVMNHTSDQHLWFQRARASPPGSRWREYYVWSDDPQRYSEARVIFSDFEASNWSWDPVAGAYYWHRFYSHQPDLNYDNPEVRRAMFGVLDFWFELGVDGVRLDAVPYLFEREGTNCENLDETHQLLKELRAHVDSKWRNRMLLAEANQWPEDAAAYFGAGDECHMNFHFPVMPRLFMAVRMEDRLPIVDILEQTPEVPPGCQWATFLRNHDELTLEMVTDEERDYMVRAYAHDPQMRVNLGIRRRLAPLLQDDRRKLELLNGLLFSLPGTPVLYYGDEIGMGDNVYLGDRDSVRTPMQWSPDRNAGFSRANPQKLFLPPVIDPEYHYETVNVESQLHNTNSLLWWTRRLIALARRHLVFARGDLRFIESDNAKVLAFIRTLAPADGEDAEAQRCLVVANLSRHAQALQLDLREHQGLEPVEMFGHTRFAPIGELPYYLTLAPYQFFWFALEPSRSVTAAPRDERELPLLGVERDWREFLRTGAARRAVADVVPRFLEAQRWFAGKDRTIRSVTITDVVPFGGDRRRPLAYLAIAEVRFVGADPDLYLIPLTCAHDERAAELLTYRPDVVLARIERKGGSEVGLLVDAIADAAFCESVIDSMVRRREHRGGEGTLTSQGSAALRRLAEAGGLEPRLMGAEQSNTSVVYGDRIVVKLVRRLEEGENPELELGAALTTLRFPNIAPALGSLGYRRSGSAAPAVLAIAQGYVHNEGDAWSLAVDVLGRFFDEAVTSDLDPSSLPVPAGSLEPLAGEGIVLSEEVVDLVGPVIEPVELLAQRTAELHLALASLDGEAFAPTPFSAHYQRSLYQSFRSQTRATLALIRRRLAEGVGFLAPATVAGLASLVESEQLLLERFSRVREERIEALRSRVHGDYHLGQVLWTGRDMVIIDFEGEPSRPIGERRIKRSPIVDVAGMLRSFGYATATALGELAERGVVTEDQAATERLASWAGWWRRWVETVFLARYFETLGGSALVPASQEHRGLLLEVYGLEKALYELRYELRYRPSWVSIPLGSVLESLAVEATE